MKILDIPRSGSYAGFTSSKNRFGQYVRNRRAPVQPIGTGRRAFIRAAFGAASVAWASLTPEQQGAWDSFAAAHPVTNSLGASVTLTGHQMFVAVGTQRQNIAAAIGTEPPTTTETWAIGASALEIDDVPTVTMTFAVTGVTGKALVAFSPPLSPGRRFPTRFWQEASVAAAAGTVAHTATGPFTAEFGNPTLGQRVFCKITPVNAEGWTGTPLIVSTIVVAGP